MQIRDAQEYVQILEQELHERVDEAAVLARQNWTSAQRAHQSHSSAPASPMHGAVVCSTTLNAPQTHSGAVQMGEYSSRAPSANGGANVALHPPGYPSHQAQEVHHAPAAHAPGPQPVASFTPTHAYAQPQYAQHNQARMPLADAGNVPAFQQAVHQAPCVPSHVHCYSQTSSMPVHHPQQPCQGHDWLSKDIFSGRYRSGSLMRMQRLQDRLHASERDLTYRLQRLLGGADCGRS